MNKKLMKVAFVAAIALVGGINVYNAQKSDVFSDIVLANVEALAEEEWTSSACWWVWQYTICDYIGNYEGCPCGSHG